MQTIFTNKQRRRRYSRRRQNPLRHGELVREPQGDVATCVYFLASFLAYKASSRGKSGAFGILKL